MAIWRERESIRRSTDDLRKRVEHTDKIYQDTRRLETGKRVYQVSRISENENSRRTN